MQHPQQLVVLVVARSASGYTAITCGRLHDLPASGRRVHLNVRVRRFFCQEFTCQRKIFAERFPSLTLPHVKFTLRLQEALREMGFELGGEAAARLGKKLSYPGSSDTVLRLVKQTQLQPSRLRAWWELTIGVGNEDCAMER